MHDTNEARKVLREIQALKKLSSMKSNVFTSYLIDVIVPDARRDSLPAPMLRAMSPDFSPQENGMTAPVTPKKLPELQVQRKSYSNHFGRTLVVVSPQASQSKVRSKFETAIKSSKLMNSTMGSIGTDESAKTPWASRPPSANRQLVTMSLPTSPKNCATSFSSLILVYKSKVVTIDDML